MSALLGLPHILGSSQGHLLQACMDTSGQAFYQTSVQGLMCNNEQNATTTGLGDVGLYHMAPSHQSLLPRTITLALHGVWAVWCDLAECKPGPEVMNPR